MQVGFRDLTVWSFLMASAHGAGLMVVPVLLQRFYYRQLMYVVLFRSVKEAVSGRPVGWHGVGTEAPRRALPAGT